MPPIIPAPNDIPGDNDEPENLSFAGNIGSAGFPLENGMVVNVILSDSESDNEGMDHNGYEPLSQDPFNPFSPETEEDESNSDAEEPVAAGDDNKPPGETFRIVSPDSPPMKVIQSEVVESTVQTIPMTQEHIDRIKAVMRDVRLPSSNVPEWASNMPEEDWKIVVTTCIKRPKNHYSYYKNGTFYDEEPSASSDKSDMSNEVLR